MKAVWEQPEHTQLQTSAPQFVESNHLRDLLQDEQRTDALTVDATKEPFKFYLDASRLNMSVEFLDKLVTLYEKMEVAKWLERMKAGDHINSTEDRAVLHWALRCQPGEKYQCDGADVTKEILDTREAIKVFSEKIRKAELKGFTGKPLVNTVCIGIGGSYLGVEFMHEAFRTHPKCQKYAEGRKLRFLANVDPIDISRALEGLDLEETLVIVLSKTFTTAETIMNAKSVKQIFINKFKSKDCISKHFCAVSTNIPLVKEFGIAPEHVFGFRDWVGGRFAACSPVGILPMAIQYSMEPVLDFLKGAHDMDAHVFATRSEPRKSLAGMLAFSSFYNQAYLGMTNVAVLPYCQALIKFPAHIQQLAMESHGKSVMIDGRKLPDFKISGEVFFGEPGTNGQHSFYQLIHQGHKIGCEFIGYTESQQPFQIEGESVANHVELMSNFFAQPDALAMGKTADQLRSEKCPENLIPHKTFEGNRPSVSLLILGECNPYNLGALLSLYENRTAIGGFLRGINSFDQYGVQLGKILANEIKPALQGKDGSFPPSTRKLLKLMK